MALLTVTEAAKAAGVSRTTLYEKIKAGELSRNSDKQIDTNDLLRVFGELQSLTTNEQPMNTEHVQPDNTITNELLDMVQSKDVELNELRAKLDDTEQRLTEHREAARALMSPEDFEAKLQKALAVEKEQQLQQEKEWQKALSDRQEEIEYARIEAGNIREREQQARAELAALERRGFIDRLLNRKPVVS